MASDGADDTSVGVTTVPEDVERAGAAEPGPPAAPLEAGDRVVVIGAGPAGLTAAYLLTERDADVVVLEADDMVGGISRTEEYKGYRFDIGGHRFYTKIEPVEEMWEEVLGEEFISVPRLSRIFYDRTFFRYPLKALDALKGLGPWRAFLIVCSYLKWHFFPYPEEENFEQWVTNRFGKRLYETFFKTYTEKVWGIPCTEISADWAAQRIKGLSLIKAILSAASVTNRSDDIKTLIHEFKYPRLGPGQMWEMTRDRVVERGGEVRMNHRVIQVEHSDGRATGVVAESPEGRVRIPADHVISSMPLRDLIRALEPPPPESVASAAEGVRYRDFFVVALILDEEDLFPDNWIYIHEPGVEVGRIQNFGNWSEALVPDEGRSCLGMEYFCFEGDGLWETADEELIDLAVRELRELGLGEGADVVDGTVVRMPKAYPIYDEGYQERLDAIRSHLRSMANLHPVGRNGMHKYNNQDHSMLTAMMAVWNMEGASYDIWRVNTGFEYLEEQKLEHSNRPAGDDDPAEETASDDPGSARAVG